MYVGKVLYVFLDAQKRLLYPVLFYRTSVNYNRSIYTVFHSPGAITYITHNVSTYYTYYTLTVGL